MRLLYIIEIIRIDIEIRRVSQRRQGEAASWTREGQIGSHITRRKFNGIWLCIRCGN